jgi:hypothetical protein
MRERAAGLLLAAALAAGPAWGQAPGGTQRMYKCVDAKGKVYYTQMPPAECKDRETQEMNKAGTVVKRHAPPPTAAERAQMEAKKEEERVRKLEEEKRLQIEKRRNEALLTTYANEKDIDEARARALKDNDDAIRETEKRVQAVQKRQNDLEKEKAFYANKPLPSKLQQDMHALETELKAQQETMEVRRKQADGINAKYDEDKRRYLELTRGSTAKSVKK